MTSVTLSLKVEGHQRINCKALQPAALCALDETKIAKLKLPVGRKQTPLAELFDIAVDDGDSVLTISSASGQLDYLGAGMTEGRLIVNGNAGNYLGHGLADGEIIVNGSAGHFAGSGQQNGLIHIKGNAGDYAGGAAPTEMQGLKGGTLMITGTCGNYLGYKMRRGIIIAHDNVGEHCANNMIAGTVILGNKCGGSLGLGMRRGTVIFLEKTKLELPTFNLCGSFSLPILTVLRHHLHSINHHAAMRLAKIQTVQRFCGDLGYDGQGEVLVANG